MIPNRTKSELFKTSIDYTSGGDTFRVALLKGTTDYTPDQDNHEFVNDILDSGVTGAEFDDTNYSRKTLSGQTVIKDNTSDQAQWDADNVTWSNLGGSQNIHAILIYREVSGTSSPSDDDVIRILDESEEADLPLATNGGDVTINWGSNGIINLV